MSGETANQRYLDAVAFAESHVALIHSPARPVVAERVRSRGRASRAGSATRAHPVFLATDALYLNVDEPPVVTDQMLIDAFGRKPGTQNPPAIREEQAMRLLELAGVAL